MIKISYFFFSWICVAFSSVLVEARAPYAAVIMEGDTQNIIAGVNQEAPMYPASLTKMMTLYLLFEALDKKKVSFETRFTASRQACCAKPSKLGLRPGQTISVRDCILGLAVRSANDVAVVVAENLAGSREKFVHAMNRKAQRLSMEKTRFCNPSGWHDPQQKTTAYDMALLVSALRRHFGHYTPWLSQKSFRFQNRSYATTNKILHKVPGICISKTGYTDASGCNLATLTQRQGRPIIVVVMGMRSSAARDKQVKDLIEASYDAPYLVSSFLILPALASRTVEASPDTRSKMRSRKPLMKAKNFTKRKKLKNLQIPWNKIA